NVSGTVTDATTHEGVPGVDVCFHWLPEGGYYCETTGSQGKYGLQVAEKQYRVEFKGQPLGYITQFFNHELYRDSADIISVGSNEVTGLDAELVVGGEIQGMVTSSGTGEPLSDVEACAREIATDYVFACGESDSSGAYTIKGLPAGDFAVEFRPLSEYLADQFYDHKVHPWEAESVALGAGETVTGVDAAIETGARIEGTVNRLDGGIADDQIGVCARETHGFGSCTPVVNGGTYLLPGLSPGEYKVEFFSYFHELKTQFWDHAASSAEAEVLQLEMGETAAGIDADMEAEPALPTTPFAPSPLISPPVSQSTPPPTLQQAPQPFPEPRPRRHCRKGFHKKRVAGKIRCVRKHQRRAAHT
ncbi:MAG: MSCRAMM family protein, partial [Solirubrobacterales bacterium]